MRTEWLKNFVYPFDVRSLTEALLSIPLFFYIKVRIQENHDGSSDVGLGMVSFIFKQQLPI